MSQKGTEMKQDAEKIKGFVKEHYASLAKEQGRSCCCSRDAITQQAKAATEELYTDEELKNLPTDVVSLGCGNPTAIAELSEGEVVLDLGSGGGIDCFLAAQRVGKRGKVIGLDMTPEMIQLARVNAKKTGAGNVEFRLGEMERMPISDNSVDVVISNCVINLSPDKDTVFSEAFRVLKPGGRLCVSDIVLLAELPEAIKENPELWAGCVAGAIKEDIYLDKIRAAGFTNITTDKSPTSYLGEDDMPQAQIASIRVKAFKATS